MGCLRSLVVLSLLAMCCQYSFSSSIYVGRHASGSRYTDIDEGKPSLNYVLIVLSMYRVVKQLKYEHTKEHQKKMRTNESVTRSSLSPRGFLKIKSI